MKPETMLNLIEMLMDRISGLEGENSLAVYLKDTYQMEITELKAERDKLKAENHALIAENDHLKAALVEKQKNMYAVATLDFSAKKEVFDDDED